MKTNIFLSIDSYDVKTNKLVMKPAFITDDTLEFIENNKGKTLKYQVNGFRENGSYEQQKKIWVMCRTILKWHNSKNPSFQVNAENLRAIYETIRNLFPARQIEIDGSIQYYLPSLEDLSKEERFFVIQQIEDKYSKLGVIFDEGEID